MSQYRAHSAPRQTKPPPPIPPTLPYISLPDRHLSNYFTKERLRKHLLQAGLLTKDGHIISAAEYESKQKDMAIRDDNRHKRDDAIVEVLREIGSQHNKRLNNRLQEVKQDLLNQFRRIEKQYTRRTQPIKITVSKDGRVEETVEPSTNGIDQQQIEQMIRASTVIKNLQKTISKLTQDVDATLPRLEAQIAELNALRTPLTRSDVENLVRDIIRTDKSNEPEKSDLGTLDPAVNDRITQLENLIRDAASNKQLTTSKTFVASQSEIDLEKRIALIEKRLDTSPLVENLRRDKESSTQIENRVDSHIRNVPLVGAAPSPPMIESTVPNIVYAEDSRISSLQKQIDDHTNFLKDLHKQVSESKRTDIKQQTSASIDNFQTARDHTTSMQDHNDRITPLLEIQLNDELRRKVDHIEREMIKADKDLANLRRQLTQQSTSASQPSPVLPPRIDSPVKQPTNEDYQAIMPFIEVLPTFNLFAKEEWD